MDTEKVLNCSIISGSIALCIYGVTVYPDGLSDSFFLNLIEIALFLGGSFLVVGGVTLLPGLLIALFSDKMDEMKRDGHNKLANLLIVGACVAVVVILALIAQNLKQGN